MDLAAGYPNPSWIKRKRTALKGWARRASASLLSLPRWPFLVGCIVPGAGFGVHRFCTGPDGHRLKTNWKLSTSQLFWRLFGWLVVAIVLIWLVLLLIQKLEESGWKKLSVFLKRHFRLGLGLVSLFVSMYLGYCVELETQSFDAIVIICWALFGCILLTKVPEDFGFSDAFVAANLAVAVKLPPSISCMVAAAARVVASAPSPAAACPACLVYAPIPSPAPAPVLLPDVNTLLRWEGLVKKFVIGAGPYIAKTYIADYLEAWTKWAFPTQPRQQVGQRPPEGHVGAANRLQQVARGQVPPRGD